MMQVNTHTVGIVQLEKERRQQAVTHILLEILLERIITNEGILLPLPQTLFTPLRILRNSV